VDPSVKTVPTRKYAFLNNLLLLRRRRYQMATLAGAAQYG